MTPAEELRAAAAKLREVAAAATFAPWTIVNGTLWLGGQVWGYAIPKDDGTFISGADPAWIALAHPGLAEPLAAWLDYRAGCADAMVHGVNKIPERVAFATPENQLALNVARALNGAVAS